MSLGTHRESTEQLLCHNLWEVVGSNQGVLSFARWVNLGKGC